MTPFYAQAKTFKIDVTSTASTSKALNNTDEKQIRVINDGNFTAFFDIGIGSQVATVPTTTALSTCIPIMAGEDIIFSIPKNKALQISAICNSGESTTLYVSIGDGV